MILMGCRCRRYGFFSFIWDIFMTAITMGLWLIWIFCREMRGRRYPCGSCRCD